MSYLNPEASTTQYGVVEIGGNIQVSNGVISLSQDVSPAANVTFANVSVSGNVTINGNSAVSSVIPTAGNGVVITNLVSTGPNVSFTISANTSVVNINTTVISANYTATATDEYIGVNSTTPVTITLPTGTNGREYIIKDEHGIGFGIVNVTGTGGQTIDGLSTYPLLIPLGSISVVFRGTGWHIV